MGVVAVFLTYLTGLSLPLWRACALKAILQVHAGPTLSARVGGTLIQIYENTPENRAGLAYLIQRRPRLDLKRGFPTGGRLTVGAGWTLPARRTPALKGVGDLVTRAAIGTGVGSTGVLG